MDKPILGNAIPRRGNRISQFIALTLLSLFGWRIEANIPNQPKFVLVGAPHTSNWDFILTMATQYALSVKISWMAKHSLFRWPFKGLMTWLGGVPVDRENQGSGLVNQTVDVFNKREKFVIAIMPEGTRSLAREWKTGFYRIAQEAKVPIVAVRFDYGRKVMGIGPTVEPSDDMEADMHAIKSIFTGIQGKHPDRSIRQTDE